MILISTNYPYLRERGVIQSVNQVEDDAHTLFWSDWWLQGRCIEDLVSDLVAVVPQRWLGGLSSRRSPLIAGHPWAAHNGGPYPVP
jgi:hypothetical protein